MSPLKEAETCIGTHRSASFLKKQEFGATIYLKNVERRSSREKRTRKGELQILCRKSDKIVTQPLNFKCIKQNSSSPVKDKKYKLEV